jgi:hypothetical protein
LFGQRLPTSRKVLDNLLIKTRVMANAMLASS